MNFKWQMFWRSFQNDIMVDVVTVVPLLRTNFRALYVCSRIKKKKKNLAFLEGVCVYVCVCPCVCI